MKATLFFNGFSYMIPIESKKVHYEAIQDGRIRRVSVTIYGQAANSNFVWTVEKRGCWEGTEVDYGEVLSGSGYRGVQRETYAGAFGRWKDASGRDLPLRERDGKQGR